MLKPIIKHAVQWSRRLRLRAGGVLVGAGCTIEARVMCQPGYLRQRGQVVLGPNCTLATGAILAGWGGKILLGENVFVGPYTVMYGHGGITIGEHTLISMHCRVLSSNHTVPAPGVLIRSQPDILLPTRIGRDVWLGAGVTVLGGVTIGDGCVIGAGAVVTHDLPPNTICHGVPARVVRPRTSGISPE